MTKPIQLKLVFGLKIDSPTFAMQEKQNGRQVLKER